MSSGQHRTARAALAACAALALGATACSGAGGGDGGGRTTVRIATVANPQMQDIEKLSGEFEKAHPDIDLKFSILPENELRDRVTKDIAAGSSQYDVVTIGTYETPIWAKNKWLANLDDRTGQQGYARGDLIPAVRQALSYRGSLYAVPFYGESSFLMYRKDLFAKAGLTMPKRPTWKQVARFAEKLDDPKSKRAGICLRGLPGWGELLAPLNTVINTFGGRWYDTDWKARLDEPAARKAVGFYVDLVREHGQPDAAGSGFSECLTSFGQGRSAMWYDATVAASSLEDRRTSKVAGKVGYAPAPVARTEHSGWLWAWSLAIPASADHKDAAWEFMEWATSKDYIRLVGEKLGWSRVPPGTRQSTYRIPQYSEAARSFAGLTLDSMRSVDPRKPGLHPQPWVGVQYVAIPEFQDLGTKVSQEISAAIAGNQSVGKALDKAQRLAGETAEDAELGKK